MQPAPAISENGLVTGYASLFGIKDRNNDVVLRGAFKKSLSERTANDVKFLFQHDANEPIGTWLDIYEDDKGLRVIGRLISGVTRAREAFALIRAGALDGLSIGFNTKAARREAGGRLRQLVTLDLWEISLVTFPMLPGARLTALNESEAPKRLIENLRRATRLLTANQGS
ncbi:MAG: HK97 family phage prohead protease [Pseudomonadota bacterium]